MNTDDDTRNLQWIFSLQFFELLFGAMNDAVKQIESERLIRVDFRLTIIN